MRSVPVRQTRSSRIPVGAAAHVWVCLALVVSSSQLGCSSEDSSGHIFGGGDESSGGSGATGSGAGSVFVSAGINHEGGVCEEVVLEADRTSPNMLIVLDRSRSMTMNDTDTNRLRGSVDAINTVVGELEQNIQFGLMTFPGRSGWGGNCASGQLDEPLRITNAGPIARTLAGVDSDGYTPTAQTLVEARQVLAEAEAGMIGEFARSKYVLLVTDGDPNCFDGTPEDGDPEAQMATIQEVENLTSDGVRTYVIGFQTADSEFAGVLDQMAAAGGTGDEAHRSVNSGEELLDELGRIAGAAVSCSFVLSRPVREPDVDIRVNDELVRVGDDWHLLDDSRTIELTGAACRALESGARVDVVVNCNYVQAI